MSSHVCVPVDSRPGLRLLDVDHVAQLDEFVVAGDPGRGIFSRRAAK